MAKSATGRDGLGSTLRMTAKGIENMDKLGIFLNTEAEWVLERLGESLSSETERNYYQGRIDQLAQVRRYLGQAQLLIEKVGA